MISGGERKDLKVSRCESVRVEKRELRVAAWEMEYRMSFIVKIV